MEGQITWFVYMVGAIIKGRLTTGSTDAQEVMDGDLSARVLTLLQVVDTPVLMQVRLQHRRGLQTHSENAPPGTVSSINCVISCLWC
jgi:hypothetical protein